MAALMIAGGGAWQVGAKHHRGSRRCWFLGRGKLRLSHSHDFASESLEKAEPAGDQISGPFYLSLVIIPQCLVSFRRAAVFFLQF
jgi:hypothetical protein